MIGGAPATLRAWDPFRVALQQSDYISALQDRQQIAVVSSELIRLYEGNQLAQLLRYFQTLISDDQLRRRYEELATFLNVVRLLVDRTATLGQLPVRVIAQKRQTGDPDPIGQKLWDEGIATNLANDLSWDAYVAALSRRVELCKTVVACTTWDPSERKIELDYFTPNTIDIVYEEGNPRILRPDRFRILREEATGWWQEWDFSRAAAPAISGGPPILATVRDVDGAGASAGDGGEPVTVIDPGTGTSLNPFVALRSDFNAREYFIWDGQAELIEGQKTVNRLWSQVAMNLHWSTFKQPVLSGPGWTDEEGNPPRIINDPSFAIQEPYMGMGEEGRTVNKIRWDGPGAEAVITGLLEALSFWVEMLATTFHLNPSSIRAKNEATSGYALQIESAALKAKNARTRTLAKHPLLRIVEKTRKTWDHYHPPGERFPEDTVFSLFIPDYGAGITTREEMDVDVLKLTNGLTTRRLLILKHNPEMSPTDAENLANEWQGAQVALPRSAANGAGPKQAAMPPGEVP